MENNTLPAKTKVLVVGAGPVGLACAITLAREGQQVIVVDALAVNPSGCRAGVIHANTMEVRLIRLRILTRDSRLWIGSRYHRLR